MRAFGWMLASILGIAGSLLVWFFFSGHGGLFLNQRVAEAVPTEKSIAVLPFENISANKDDVYFADGVQGEILNNLAKIAQLKVISRTSVMQYRPDAKRDLRQIAKALGVANVLEGTVRRDGNHVRLTTELIDAQNDNTIWADSYDRDLTDIFSIQSEVAQTIASKLTAALALVDRDWLEARELIEKMKGGEDDGNFAYGRINVPIGCYSILLARLQGEQPGVNSGFGETRELLNQKVQKAPANAQLLSQLAVVDALLNNKEVAVAEAKHAAELLPVSKDALVGPLMEMNLAVVYAWTNELGLAFEKLSSLAKLTNGIFYGPLKRDPEWEPLRQDPRYEKLLAELAPRD